MFEYAYCAVIATPRQFTIGKVARILFIPYKPALRGRQSVRIVVRSPPDVYGSRPELSTETICSDSRCGAIIANDRVVFANFDNVRGSVGASNGLASKGLGTANGAKPFLIRLHIAHTCTSDVGGTASHITAIFHASEWNI